MRNPAIVYIVVSVVLALLMYVSRGERHQVEGNVEIFKYRSLLAWIPLVIPIIFAPAMYLSLYMFNPNPNEDLGYEPEAGSVFFIGMFAGGVWMKTFCIKVDEQNLRVSSFFGHRSTPFRDIAKITVKNTGRWNVLDVFNTKGRRALNTSSSLQEFDDLVDLLKERTAKYHAEFKSRDARGKWSDG